MLLLDCIAVVAVEAELVTFPRVFDILELESKQNCTLGALCC